MIALIISAIISAAMLGMIIAAMEEGDFPGWGVMIICVLATVIPMAIIDMLLPASLFFVGPLVGAICGGFAISATCSMSVKRASIAAGLFLVCQIANSLMFPLLF
ncbi:MAG: hypothetical protein IID44_28370 [Planctomycetes bacterium]|nr:hypothetical protein [Planctomycetota bacterium]